MPKGVYERTEMHRAICSEAGKKSARSQVNIDRYKTLRVTINCLVCQDKFTDAISQNRRFCSKKCFDTFQTYDVPENYNTVHAWVRRNFGTPEECEHCGTTDSKKFEWANISGKYLLVRSDWARLCCQCHRRYDRGVKNRIEVLNV